MKTVLIDPGEGEINSQIAREIRSFGPDLTLSFNAILSDGEGHFLCDYIETPHLNILVDPAFYALEATRSPLNFFSSVDRADVAWFQSNGVSKIFFLPHAAKELSFPAQEERIYDVVFLGSCSDYEGLKAKWQKILSREEMLVLEMAITRMLTPPLVSLTEALASSIAKANVDPQTLGIQRLFFYLDNYVRGKDRIELIKAIKSSTVHVFGEPAWTNPESQVSWQKYFKDDPHVVLHPAVSYEESFSVMSQAKISLNSAPFFKHGSHERILNALMCGSLPLTTQNGYVSEFFRDGKDLLTYQVGRWEEADEKVRTLLEDEKRRKTMTSEGKARVIEAHTWDIRGAELLSSISKLLE